MLTDASRTLYYESLGLNSRQIECVEQMRTGSPARKVGAGALRNVVVQFWSKLNGAARDLESLSVEMLFALELELFSNALQYFVQVPVIGVERLINCKRKVHAATMDFLIFRPDAIVLVDCKRHSHWEESRLKPYEWVKQGDAWIRLPYKEWAEARGFQFQNWTPPQPMGIYLANLMVLYAFRGESLPPGQRRAADRLTRYLACEPLSISDALEVIDGVSTRTICILLASGRIFGTLKSRSLSEAEQFVLYADEQRSRDADDRCLAALDSSLNQPNVSSELLCASSTDYKAAEHRLARVQRMIKGTEQPTRRYKKLITAVRNCRHQGISPLQVCLTSYHRCGRRNPQLEPRQIHAIKDVVQRYWQSGAVRFQEDLYHHLKNLCSQTNIPVPCKTTLRKYLKTFNPLTRALRAGGRKAFHAQENPVDPRFATIPAIAPGLVMHIDSTKLDLRVLLELVAAPESACPTLYTAIDSCTDEPIGRVLAFGSACQDMCFILMRDILHRRGVLCRYVVGDRGCDLSSNAFLKFCEDVGMTVLTTPTSDPKKNSRVENAVGRVNRLSSQRLKGSTEPDKQGRRVDNRFKSYNTACHLFKTAVREVDECLFGDLPNTPTGNSIGSPLERAEFLGEIFGNVGIALPFDDSFRILTSVPLRRDISADGTKGYRHEGRTYRSAKLSEMLQAASRADEIRRDCVDPTLLYLKFGRQWVSASSRESIVLRSRGELDLLFARMMGRTIRSENARKREEISRARFDRIERANASAEAIAHLPTESRPPATTEPHESDAFDGLDDLVPFEIENVKCERK